MTTQKIIFILDIEIYNYTEIIFSFTAHRYRQTYRWLRRFCRMPLRQSQTLHKSLHYTGIQIINTNSKTTKSRPKDRTLWSPIKDDIKKKKIDVLRSFYFVRI